LTGAPSPSNVVGYINFNEWTVGGPDESFWGSLLEEQILDKDDKQIGEVDFGRAWVHPQLCSVSPCAPLLTGSAHAPCGPSRRLPSARQVRDQVGNTVCEMENTGECKGHDCSFI